MDDWLDIDTVEEAMKVQICFKIKRLMAQRKESKASNKDFNNS